MISRRQIIENQEELGGRAREMFRAEARKKSGQEVGVESRPNNLRHSHSHSQKLLGDHEKRQLPKTLQHDPDGQLEREDSEKCFQDYEQEVDNFDDAASSSGSEAPATLGQSHQDYRHFDPYSVYGEEDEEEDVWYSEERLFEVSSGRMETISGFRLASSFGLV